MLGRTFLVVLFFWAALTIVTPILVRMSASAKLLEINGETTSGGSQSSKVVSLLSRRALGSMARRHTERPALGPTSAPSPTPTPTPTPISETHVPITFELEVSRDTRISSVWLNQLTTRLKRKS